MSQSLVMNWVHLVFSTKHREPTIPPEHGPDLYAYQTGILMGWESLVDSIGGTEDHVHILFSLSKNQALKKVVEEVKKGSSKWMKTAGPQNARFYWQAGYGAFSVSQSNLEKVREYIANQAEHHRKLTFQEEFRAMCERLSVALDERYAWD